jgi:hypothetical protein
MCPEPSSNRHRHSIPNSPGSRDSPDRDSTETDNIKIPNTNPDVSLRPDVNLRIDRFIFIAFP